MLTYRHYRVFSVFHEVSSDAFYLISGAHANALGFSIRDLLESLCRQLFLASQCIFIGILVDSCKRDIKLIIDLLSADEEKYNTPLVHQVDPGDPNRRRSSILEETEETPKKKDTKERERDRELN